MAANTFDALEDARALEAAGMERRQAEAAAEPLRFAAGADRDRLAAKEDLDPLRTAAKTDIVQLRTATKAGFVRVRAGANRLRAEMKAAPANVVNRMLFAQRAIAGLPYAARKPF